MLKNQCGFIMRSKSIKYTHFSQINVKKLISISSSFKESKRNFFARNSLKMNMKAQSILAIVLVLIMLVSVFAWLSAGTQSQPSIIEVMSNGTIASPSATNQQTSTPNGTRTSPTPSDNDQWNPLTIITEIINPTPKPAGLIELNPNVNVAVWKTVAANAWQYFQPDNGVDSNTGLPKASLGFPYFTDWDLGVYIQAIIDANQTGLIGNEGDWGSNARIAKVLDFLETRALNNASYPFWFYQASDQLPHKESSDKATTNVDTVDTGRLFIALNNLKTFNNSLASRIDKFVYNQGPQNRSDYAALVPSVLNDCKQSISIYTYYYASGFASFWPNDLAGATTMVLNNINNAGTTTSGLNGVSLPNASILCEPLLCSVFELNNNPKLMNLSKQVYLAHEARYNATGQYVAFSEGNGPRGFIYEWVVLPSGETWKIMNAGETSYSDINPIIYTKVSMSFLALYNTTFSRNMAIYLEQSFPDSTSGYYAGADFGTVGNGYLVLSIDNNSNGMILGAAKYAIKNYP
jgi:hypothetical protein